MAVVQISRIQVRRGKANAGTGFPQLASGELGWAVDAQQLYIGNGSVAEGSPAVGNTKILTQNDLTGTTNFLQQVQHIYRVNDTTVSTGPDANNPVLRTLQVRLDDRVSTVDFGTIGDNVIDDTAAIQRAINQLFLNATTPANANTVAGSTARVILQMPPGTYKTTGTIYIPSYASLIGAGADKTIINYNPVFSIIGTSVLNSYTISTISATNKLVGALITGTGIPNGTTVASVVVGTSITLSAAVTQGTVSGTFTLTLSGAAFQFVNDNSTIGSPSTLNTTTGPTQPRNIQLKGLTIRTGTGINTCLQLDAVKDSTFEDLNLQGDWASTLSALSCGIDMRAVSSLVTCENNLFKNIKFTSFSYGVFAKYDIRNNRFEKCFFTDGYQGISFGAGATGAAGQQLGPRENEMIACKFYNIKRHAVYIEQGYSNVTRECKYINVGNNGGGNTSAIYPQVFFNAHGNTSQDDYSDRPADLASTNLSSRYVPEVAGHGTYKLQGTRVTTLTFVSSTDTLAFRLPVSSSAIGTPSSSVVYRIEYFYKSNSNAFTRRGTMSLSIDVDSKQYQMTDEYDFAGAVEGNSLILDFKAKLLDTTGAVYLGNVGQTVGAIGIFYTNNLNGDSGPFGYSYSAIL